MASLYLYNLEFLLGENFTLWFPSGRCLQIIENIQMVSLLLSTDKFKHVYGSISFFLVNIKTLIYFKFLMKNIYMISQIYRLFLIMNWIVLC